MPGIKVDHTTTKPTYTYSQSWINSFLMCPERARQEMLNPIDSPSDSTAIGQGLHAYAEARLVGQDIGISARLALDAFDEQVVNPNFTWQKIKTRPTAVKYIKEACAGWETHVLPYLGEVVSIEETFDIPLVETDTAFIRLMGAWDLETEGMKLDDWKTAGRPYEPWEAQRFKIQPTVYTLALAHKYGIQDDPAALIEFEYKVCIKGSGNPNTVQPVPAPRGPSEWEWLREQCVAITELIQKDLTRWPLNDQGWWCSAKWCDYWSECKGKYV